VVFITDGEPTTCLYGGSSASTNTELANMAETAYLGSGIRTYAISMQGANTSALDAIAVKGGTAQAFVIGNSNQQQVATDLTTALQAIAGQNASCDFPLPNQGLFDPGQATITYTPGSGSATTLPKQPASTGCGSGWYFDDNATPTTITLCPSTCTTVQADTAAKVEVYLGCPALAQTTVFTQKYFADCPPATGPVWQYLAYDITRPGDSAVKFRARVARTEQDLALATYRDIATAPSSPDVCPLSGPRAVSGRRLQGARHLRRQTALPRARDHGDSHERQQADPGGRGLAGHLLVSAQRIALLGAALGAAAIALAACSGADERPPPVSNAGRGATGGSGASGGAGGSGDTGGTAGSQGAGGDPDAGPDGSNEDASGGTDNGDAQTDATAGTGGEPEPDAGTCGNGVVEPGEGCEGNDLAGKTCRTYGYDEGTPRCVSCAIDIRGCTGSERCGNGRDDDGDGDTDCLDDECASACNSPCSTIELLPDPSTTQSTTAGHASNLTPSCLLSGTGSTGEVVYRVNVETSGVLDVKLTSSADLNLSIRGECASAESERACSENAAGTNAREHVVVPAARGDSLFVVVDGSGEIGTFTLDVRSRPLRCGDRHRDPGEDCDDGNVLSADGCSTACRIEASEAEPNATPAQASAYSGAKAVGSIAPAGDVDVYAVDVLTPNTDLRAEIVDFGDGTCESCELDSYVEILDKDGTTVLNGDDDRGAGYCSIALAWGLGVGRYYVRVTAFERDPDIRLPADRSLLSLSSAETARGSRPVWDISA
jgi:cysteine-rich repeat protein